MLNVIDNVPQLVNFLAMNGFFKLSITLEKYIQIKLFKFLAFRGFHGFYDVFEKSLKMVIDNHTVARYRSSFLCVWNDAGICPQNILDCLCSNITCIRVFGVSVGQKPGIFTL